MVAGLPPYPRLSKGATLLLLGLGVAAAGLLVVGGISVLVGSSKKSQPKAETVKGS